MALQITQSHPYLRLRSSGSLPVPQRHSTRSQTEINLFTFEKYPGVAKRRGKAPAETFNGAKSSSLIFLKYLDRYRLSLWNGLAPPFFSWSQRRPQPCHQRQPKSVRVRSKGLQTMGLQAFFSIWRDYVERFKYPKRSVERPCSRHLS